MTLKGLELLQWPVFHSQDEYESSIEAMSAVLKSIAGVKSIFQVGGISDYGISDIDMLVIFKAGTNTHINPLLINGQEANRYLFTHRLFGTTENRIPDLENYTRFGKYKMLYGNEQSFSMTLPESDLKIMEKQIALEYMIKAYISLHIALNIGRLKIRNFLLHVKALKLDLELLGINNGAFYQRVIDFINMRKTWFNNTPDASTLQRLIIGLYHEFSTLLEVLMQQHPFYLPARDKIKISRNIELKNYGQFKTDDTVIPALFKNLIPGNKKESILNRLYNFTFRFPVTSHEIPEVIQKRYDYIHSGVEYNKTNLPFFLCTAYGLDIFSRKS
jgi:hypothetical protein